MKTKGSVSTKQHKIRCHKCNKEFLAKDSKAKWCSSHCKYLVYGKPNRRKYALKAKFDLSLEQYNLMYKNQSGTCAICHQPDNQLCVDHNHATGEVRGLLCNKCNTGIGMFVESPTYLVNAKKYLDSHTSGMR